MIFKLGIDPGLTGSMALMHDNAIIEIWDMPTVTAPAGKGKIVSPQLLADIIIEIKDIVSRYSGSNTTLKSNIEQVGAMPGNGTASMFKFGRCLGVIEGVIAGNYIPIAMVTPQKWKKGCGLIGKGKDASRQLCLQMFPDKAHYFKRKKDNGRSDAVLIALYQNEQKQ